MIFFYLFALIPIAAGLILWYKNREIVLKEFYIGSGVALGLAFSFHMIALATIHSKTSDLQTLSGKVTSVEYHPQWVEQYIQHHSEQYQCGTDSKGNAKYCTRTWTTTEHATHYEHWEANRYFGKIQDNITVDNQIYNKIKNYFGNSIINGGKQSTSHGGHKVSGDNTIYSTHNNTGFLYPATVTKSFKNKIKATPNLFQFSKIPTNILIEPWPSNPNWNLSDRLIGTASICLDKLSFDQLNTRLGLNKKVNLILIGVGDKDETYGQYYQAAWIGGKKNDLVVVFGRGGKNTPAKWAYCFGWTEKDIVKRNLETIFLTNPINADILSKVEIEVNNNYVIKDWKKFDYIKINPPASVYSSYIFLVFLIQIGLYVYFYRNGLNKNYWRR